MDDNKKQLLTDIFWEMNEINSRTETKTETVITESDDGHGNIVQTETTVTRTYLYITVSHKTAEEMADKYGFNADQREQLSELLAEENNSLSQQILLFVHRVRQRRQHLCKNNQRRQRQAQIPYDRQQRNAPSLLRRVWH